MAKQLAQSFSVGSTGGLASIALVHRPPTSIEAAQIAQARKPNASDAEVFAALKLTAIGWTGTDEPFSQGAFEMVISPAQARALLDKLQTRPEMPLTTRGGDA